MSQHAKKRHRQSKTNPGREPSPFGTFASQWWVAAIFCATLAVYWPALTGGLLWDDPAHITRPELRSLDGLRRIWFELGATQQYYPLTHTVFWLGHKLWGDAVLGYHLVNVLLHAGNAVLLGLVLGRLNVPGAKLAAIVFALHPVHVESVAWITELKNTLSTLLYLTAAMVYLRFERDRRLWAYAVAFLLFVMSLLSKSVTATLPAALLVIFWWQRGRLEWRRDVVPLLPWFVIGITSGMFTAWVERQYVGATSALLDLSPVERCLIAGQAIWFYLWKLAWPVNLVFIYPKWEIDARSWQWVAPIAVVGAFAALALSRQRLGRAPLAAILLFVGTLFPALGFFNVYPFVYTFVADHFVYLASVGPIALASASITYLAPRMRAAIYGLAVITLAILTFNQCHIYKDAETLYRATIERNRECWMAYNNLGTLLIGQGKPGEAILLYEQGIPVSPGGLPRASLHTNLGKALMLTGRRDEAARHFGEALTLSPDYPDAHNQLGAVLMAAGQHQQAIAEIEQAIRLNRRLPEAHNNLGAAFFKLKRFDEAIPQYLQAIALRPDYVIALSNLGDALSASGRAPEAVQYYRQALEHQPDSAELHQSLAASLAATGQPREAVIHFRRALELKPAYPIACNNLAWLYATCADPQYRDAAEAVRLAQRALELTGEKDASVLDTLAAAYAESRRYSEAVAAAEAALDLARAANDQALANEISRRLTSYREGVRSMP